MRERQSTMSLSPTAGKGTVAKGATAVVGSVAKCTSLLLPL